MPEINFAPNNEQPDKSDTKASDEKQDVKWTEADKVAKEQTAKFDVFNFLKSMLKPKDNETIDKKDKNIITEQQDNVKKEKNAKLPDKGEGKGSGLKNISLGSVRDKMIGGNRWKASHILKTNLIKGEVTTFFNWKKNLLKLGISLGWTAVLIGIIYMGLIVKEKNLEKKSYDIVQEIERLDVIIASYEEDKKEIDAFKKKVDLVSGLLDKHIYWTNILRFFEEHTLPSVTYLDTALVGQPEGHFVFSAKTDTFENMVNQIKVFELLDEVIEVNFSGGIRNIEEIEDEKTGEITKNIDVTFDLDITLDKNVFYK